MKVTSGISALTRSMARATRSMGTPQLSRRWTVTRTFGPGRPSASASRGSIAGAAMAAVASRASMTVLPVTSRFFSATASDAQRLGSRHGGRVMDEGQAIGKPAVDLLRVGAVDVVGAQPGLHVGHRDHPVERGESGGEGGGGVAVDQHDVGPHGLEHRVDAPEHGRGDVAETLLLLHDPQVVVDGEGERFDHLVEHLPVLPGEADEHLESPATPKLQHHGSHLDGLRPGAEGDEHRGTGHGLAALLGWTVSWARL